MPIDIQDYQSYVSKQKESNARRVVRDAAANFRYLTQASVSASDLTGSASWDLFLRYAKGAADETREQLLKTQSALSGPRPLSGDQLIELRVQCARLDERIRTIEAMIGLPSDVMKMGDKAKGLLARMETDDFSTGPHEPASGPSGEGEPAPRGQRSRSLKRPRSKPAA